MVAHFFWMKECPLHDMKLLQMQPVLKDTELYLKHIIGFMVVGPSLVNH